MLRSHMMLGLEHAQRRLYLFPLVPECLFFWGGVLFVATAVVLDEDTYYCACGRCEKACDAKLWYMSVPWAFFMALFSGITPGRTHGVPGIEPGSVIPSPAPSLLVLQSFLILWGSGFTENIITLSGFCWACFSATSQTLKNIAFLRVQWFVRFTWCSAMSHSENKFPLHAFILSENHLILVHFSWSVPWLWVWRGLQIIDGC